MRHVSWNNAIKSLVEIMSNPDIPAGYEGLRRFYNSIGRQSDSEALSYLLEEKFSADDSNNSQKQRENNTKNS